MPNDTTITKETTTITKETAIDDKQRWSSLLLKLTVILFCGLCAIFIDLITRGKISSGQVTSKKPIATTTSSAANVKSSSELSLTWQLVEEEGENKTSGPCFRTLSNSGGFGNRLGVLICQLGLVKSIDPSSRLLVLWNAVNDGTPATVDDPENPDIQIHGGYSLDTLLQLVYWPWEWVIQTSSNNKTNDADLSYYNKFNQEESNMWKQKFLSINAQAVEEFTGREQWLGEQTQCYNVPSLQETKIHTNDYTPEPCYTRFQSFAKYNPEFGYLKNAFTPTSVTKSDFVNSLQRYARHIKPKVDLCLPPQPYVVLHSRRGDRNSAEHVNNIIDLLAPNLSTRSSGSSISLCLISEDKKIQQDLSNEAKAKNIRLIQPTCSIQDLMARYSGVHLNTVAVLLDYFTMTHSVGVITDFLRTESSFSTSAALGHGIAMLFPGKQSEHKVNEYQNTGNQGERMQNVYFLEHMDEFFQRVINEAGGSQQQEHEKQ